MLLCSLPTLLFDPGQQPLDLPVGWAQVARLNQVLQGGMELSASTFGAGSGVKGFVGFCFQLQRLGCKLLSEAKIVHLAVAAGEVEQHTHSQLSERLQLIARKLLESRLVGVSSFPHFTLLVQSVSLLDQFTEQNH